MEGLRQWWLNTLSAALAGLGKLVRVVVDGVGENWNVRAFILIMAVVVIITGISMWRRRA